MIDADVHPKSCFSFHVTNMSSNRSVDVVVRVVLALDGDAVVRIDRPMRRIEIEPSKGEARDFSNAIYRAGFTPMRQWLPEQAPARAHARVNAGGDKR